MPKFYVPTSGPDDWKQLLANPDRQWRTGYSAKALACRWEESKGFPPEVASLFANSALEAFRGIELLLAIPEHQVPLPGGGASSQCDLWCLAKAHDRLVSIAVEGKVAESFGPTLAQWSRGMSNGKRKRLEFIKETLGINSDIPENVRYQLLHRAAAAVIEARRFNVPSAVLLIHSFSHDRARFEDFAAFLELMGARTLAGLVELGKSNGVGIFAGWVVGDWGVTSS